MKKLFPVFLLLLPVTALVLHSRRAFVPPALIRIAGAPPAPRVQPLSLRRQAENARAYVRGHGLNTQLCFLIDMSLPSGHNRFFAYDLSRDTIVLAGLVAHGCCNEQWLTGRRYGNTVGCGCTSLGHYRIGARYDGRFGRAFKLHGLDSTNNQAYARNVVLHSYWAVPSSETDEEICQSNGCPMVAPAFLARLEPIINGSTKNILLWIFE